MVRIGWRELCQQYKNPARWLLSETGIIITIAMASINVIA